MTLVDSDVLIWVMRGEVRANAFLETLPSIALSAVNHIELIQGMRNRRELKALRDFMRVWDAQSFPITESISTRAVKLVERHFLSHHLQLADALIAATALEHKLVLATGNSKHFKMIAGLKIKPFTLD
jgi:predicted nucleic acid-binding protein